MAIALQAASLLNHGHPVAAEAYCASRLPPRSAAASNFGAMLRSAVLDGLGLTG